MSSGASSNVLSNRRYKQVSAPVSLIVAVDSPCWVMVPGGFQLIESIGAVVVSLTFQPMTLYFGSSTISMLFTTSFLV